MRQHKLYIECNNALLVQKINTQEFKSRFYFKLYLGERTKAE